MKHLGFESIYFMKDKKAFFLGNWAKCCQADPKESLDSTVISSKISEIKKELTSHKLAQEIQEVAYVALKLKGIDCSDLQRIQNPKLYSGACEEYARRRPTKES